MSQEEEYEEPLEDDPQEEEEPLDPAALREQIAAQVREELETEFQSHKDRFEQAEANRWNQRLRDVVGVELDERGDLRPVDPVRVNQFAARGPQAQIDPLDAPINFYVDDEETVHAKMARRDERLIAKVTEQVRAELAPLRSLAAQPAFSQVGRIAKEALEAQGMSGFAEHPKFEETVVGAVRAAVDAGTLPADALNNPQAIGGMVGYLAFSGQLQRVEQSTQRERDSSGRYIRDAMRGSLASTGPSRGTPGNGSGLVALDDEDRRNMEEMDMDEGQYRAFAESQNKRDPDIYHNYMARRREKAGRR